MTAAVYGRQTLDELQQLVVDAFSPVVDQQLPVPAFPPDVFCDEVCVCVSGMQGGALAVAHLSCT